MVKFYKNGIKFICRECGACCANPEKTEACLYLSMDDIKNISMYMNISLRDFKNNYTLQKDSYIILKEPDEDCLFLENNRCKIYPVRPAQCRAWPFWESMLNIKSWKESVRSICKGIGNGKLYSCKDIEYISKEISPL